jgi:hypothetical protein
VSRGIYLAGSRYDIIQMNLSSVTSLINSKIKESMEIYPNPANDFLMISMKEKGDYKGMLYSEGGSLIREISFSGSDFKLNLKDISGGNYFLQLVNGDKNYLKVIVVSNR